MKKFVLISRARSGSSMIINSLNLLDDFNVYGEIFARFDKNKKLIITHPQKIQRDLIRRNKRKSFDCSKHENISNYLDEIFDDDRNVGFKLLFPHIKRFGHDKIFPYLKSKNIYTIYLTRENRVKQFISARTNNKKVEKIYIDLDDFISHVNEMQEDENNLSDLLERELKIDRKIIYEDITKDDDIKSFNLSILFPEMNREVNVLLRKYRPKTLRENIKNYNSLKKGVAIKAPHILKWMEE